ncbi:16S rRNA processing protein RimM [candidate division KSB1 bacterium]|nr:16S rRNA processing protein RimM [candidate division KSB1 bacterium]
MPQKDQQGGKWPDFVVIGRVLRPHGVRGVLRVKALSDHPRRFQIIRHLYLSHEGEGRKLFTIHHAKTVHGAVLLQLHEIQTREQAELWRGALVEIPGAEVPHLPEGKQYLFELIGLEVQTQNGLRIGALSDVISYPWHDVYVVRNDAREYLIPAVADIILDVDEQAGVMTINAIDGLLD